jgi:hypothetical protein
MTRTYAATATIVRTAGISTTDLGLPVWLIRLARHNK